MNAFLLQAYCGFYSPIEPKYLPAIATGETNTTRPAVFVGSEIPRGFRPVDLLHKSCNGPFETLFAWMSQNVNLNTHDSKLEQRKKPLGANENSKWKSAGNRHCPSHWLVERMARVFLTNGTERVRQTISITFYFQYSKGNHFHSAVSSVAEKLTFFLFW